jgi:hypothetical protein
MSAARIIVIGPKSFGWNNNSVMLLDPARRYAWHALPDADIAAMNARARQMLPADTYVDILGTISDSEGRVPVFTPDHKFISHDHLHLTRAGAAWLGAILFRNPPLRALHDGRPAAR